MAVVDRVDEIAELSCEGRLPNFAAVGVWEREVEAEVADGSEVG